MGQAPASRNCNKTGKGVPFVKAGEFRLLRPEICEWTDDPLKRAKDGDILLCVVGATCGKINLGIDCAIGRSVAALRPKPNLLQQYLYYFMMTQVLSLRGGSTGAAQTVISKDMIFDLEIPLPPLAEQKRIVALLDEAFAGIEEAKAKTKACASEARKFYQESVGLLFSKISDGKESCALGDTCSFVRGPFGGSLKKQNFIPEGYAVYEQQHAIYDQFSDVRYFIPESKFREMKRFELFPGDLIMSCSGTMGRVAIAPDGIMPGIINQALLKLTPGKKVQAMFLKYWMESSSFQEALKKYAGGAAIQNVASVKILKEIMIPLPSMTEQGNLVRSIICLREETERAAYVFEMKTNALDELKKSLLAQAFAGELTA
jgi:type I restriction enzyme S subunit